MKHKENTIHTLISHLFIFLPATKERKKRRKEKRRGLHSFRCYLGKIDVVRLPPTPQPRHLPCLLSSIPSSSPPPPSHPDPHHHQNHLVYHHHHISAISSSFISFFDPTKILTLKFSQSLSSITLKISQI